MNNKTIIQKISLDKLKVAQEAFIESVETDDKALRQHILNMGLTPGVEVMLVKTAPMGDPLELRLRGYEMTIRKADASKIFIKDIHNANKCFKQNKKFDEVVHSKKGEQNAYSTRKSENTKPAKSKLLFALAGNQNSGKTTLFNRLTGANQHVGNFPGVTVEKIEGVLKNNKNVTIADLPGIYSLCPYSSEEIVTRNFILKQKPDGIINIIDAMNIERNLLLTMQLIELEIPMVIALNMIDEVVESSASVDVNGLEATLQVPVIPISASKNQGVDELMEHAINVATYQQYPGRIDFCEANSGLTGATHRCIHSIIHLIENHAQKVDIPVRFAATKLAEGDPLIIESLNLDKNDLKACNKIIEQMEKEKGLDRQAAIADMRFSFIESLSKKFVYRPYETAADRLSKNIDKILTGKYTAIPAFLAIMSFIFYCTFGFVGSFLSDIMEIFINNITEYVDHALYCWGLNHVFHSLIIDGVFEGVGSVLSFLPTIVILFFFLSLLEDSGYMARVAFVMDKLLRKIGLSGRSFVPLLIGFGCSVPAIMATRTLPSERDRKMTIFLTPFMSCSAKLPIYALFTAAFFAQHQVLVILSLYIIGIIIGIICAYIMKLTVFKGEPVPFVMELPNYRMPSAKNVFRFIFTKAEDFVKKAFTIIFGATILIWFLKTFDARLNIAVNSSQSLLAILGNIITPIFKPLGINDWRISTSFITGFMAKESVVSTLSVLLNGSQEKLSTVFSPLSAFVFLVFSLLYTPCVAAVATVKRELGRFYAFLVVLIQCSIAWVVAFIVNITGSIIL